MPPTFLATTALTDFWDRGQELLFLGSWCLPYDRRSQWKGIRGALMPSPWDDPGRSDWIIRQCREDVPVRLVEFLGETLNQVLGVSRSQRYWRLLLGPWAATHVAAVADHWLHLDAAFRRSPGLQTIGLDHQDFCVPRDVDDQRRRLLTDSCHLQLFCELMTGMGRTFPTRRLGAGAGPGPAPRPPKGWKDAAREVLGGAVRGLRSAEFADAYFSGLGLDDKQSFALVRFSKGKVLPVAEEMPEAVAPAPEAARRWKLTQFPAHDELDRLVARTLPTHFPTMFLEGYHAWRAYVLSAWPRPPERLLASGGWQSDGYLAMLAAESVESGGRVAVGSTDGAGLLEPLQRERQERAVADQFWTWGWTERDAGAGLKAMAHPRYLPARRAGKGKPPERTLLVGTSLPQYPYVEGFDHYPVWHRFYDYLKERERYLAALPPWARDTVCAHIDAPDFGWGHEQRLAGRFPGLRCEPAPWRERLDRVGLLVFDNPRCSLGRALASGAPTLIFWDPALWRSRPGAGPALDALRRAGVLHDHPESAAAKTAAVLKDPAGWWREEGIQRARAEFCRLFARSEPDWAKSWVRAAREL